MKYLKIFFHVLRNSFSSALYYKEILRAPFSFSLKYFFLFSFLLSILMTVFLSFKIIRPLNDFLTRFPKLILNVYPAGLEVKIKNGVISTNVKQPYFIPLKQIERKFREELFVQGARSDEIQNLVVIDTKASIDDFKSYQTLVLLTKKHISYLDDNGTIRSVPLENVSNLTINRNLINNAVRYISSLLVYIPFIAVALIFMGSLFYTTTGQLLYLLVTALALFLIAKAIKYPLAYKKAYQIDLHLATVFMPMFLLLSLLNVNIQFPLLRLILYTIAGYFILNKIRSTPQLVS